MKSKARITNTILKGWSTHASNKAQRWDGLSQTHQSWPLHAKPVERLDLSKLRQDFPELVETTNWLIHTEEYPKKGTIRFKPQSVPSAHRDEMLKKNYWRILEANETPENSCEVLYRVEEEKQRLRMLGWPRELNDEMYLDESELLDTLECQRGLPGRGKATCHDLAISFNQLELSREVSRHFTFRLKDDPRIFAWNVALMGFTRSSDTMHRIQRVLAVHAARDLQVRVDAFVDNARFFSTDTEHLMLATQRYEALCAYYKVTLNVEEVNKPHEVGNFLGVTNDYRGNKRRLAPKHIPRIAEIKEALLSRADINLDELRKCFGRMIWYSRVLRYSIPMAMDAIKFFRRRSSEYGDSPHTRFTIWNSILPVLRHWLDFLSKNEWVSNEPPDTKNTPTVLFSDSSIPGYGGVLITPDGQIFNHGTSWLTATYKPKCARPYTSRDINVLEMAAVAANLEHFADLIVGPLVILVDNTSTMFSLAKGSAYAALMQMELKEIHKRLPENVAISVVYVDTENNIADWAARPLRVCVPCSKSLVA